MNKLVKFGAIVFASTIIGSSIVEPTLMSTGNDTSVYAKSKKKMTYKAYAKYLQNYLADSKVRWSPKLEAMAILPTKDNADLMSEYADTYMTDGELDSDELSNWNDYTALIRKQAKKAKTMTKSAEPIEIVILNPENTEMALYDYDAYNDETNTDAFNGIGNDYTD